MANITGSVAAKSSTKFGHGILVDNKWYNSKFPIACDKGDTVEFDDGGKNYVKSLRVVAKGSGSGGGVGTASASAVGAGAVAGPANRFNRGAFPIPANDGTRSIVRQNSVTNAVALVSALIAAKRFPAEDDAVVTVLEIARTFEKYSSGDLDKEIEQELDEQFEVK